MSKRVLSVVLLAGIMFCQSANAELQQMSIGGELFIRARYWSRQYTGNSFGPSYSGISPGNAPGRSMGPAALGITSRHDLDFVEMRTRLHIDAEFSDDVSSFVEVDSVDNWGTGFRSTYQSGADFSSDAVGADDVSLYQAYIQMENIFDSPFRVRVGRQEMKLGKGWLIDDRVTTAIGMSFDEVRVTYEKGPLIVDAWYGILATNPVVEEDGDVTFSGVYGTYKPVDPLSISAYWLWIRDPRKLSDTSRGAFGEWIEGVFDLDDYDATNLNTVGARLFGGHENWDYDWELAYQFGESDSEGVSFRNNSKFGIPSIYGDTRSEYGAFATELEVGYTFDAKCKPRVSLGGFYYGGEDNRDLSFLEWLNPFDRTEASVSFNRLCRGEPYHRIIRISQDTGNWWQLRADVQASVTPAVTVRAEIAKYGVLNPVEWPVSVKIRDFHFPIAPALPFWTKEASDDIGWVISLSSKYKYSKDLTFDARWEHLFQGNAFDEGSYNFPANFLTTDGSIEKDADYFHLRATISF